MVQIYHGVTEGTEQEIFIRKPGIQERKYLEFEFLSLPFLSSFPGFLASLLILLSAP